MNILIRLESQFRRPISEELTRSLGIKTLTIQRAVVWFGNVFNYLAYDWTDKDEWKVTRYDPKQVLLDISVLPITNATQ